MSVKDKKLGRVTSEGKGVTAGNKPQIQCMICSVNVPASKLILCETCLCGKYCSVDCKKKDKNHTQYCSMICNLEMIENEKRVRNEIAVTDSEKLSYKMKLQLIRLVGERPLVNIYLNGEDVQGLWDTGVMI